MSVHPGFANRARYDIVSRVLHWLMACLLTWQFTSAALHLFAEDTPAEAFFWSTHHSIGFTLWVLVFARGAWALLHLKRRKTDGELSVGERVATLGHLLMYGLMVAVPSLAILRSASNGRGLEVFGLRLIAADRPKITILVELGSALHSVLGWTLLALIVGHVAMAIYHSLIRRDGVLRSMI